MGILLDQFVTATKEWQQRVDQPYRESRQNGIVTHVLFFTGGGAFIEPLDRMDQSTLTPEQMQTLTVGEVEGYYSVEQMQSHLETMVERFRILEPFLIVALVRAVADELEWSANMYETGIAKNQSRIEELQAIANDPEEKAIYLQNLREAREELVSTGQVPPNSDVIDDEDIQRHIEMLRKFTQLSPEEKERRLRDVALWREVTQELMSPDNLERARKEMFDEIG
jgi:aminopeptidase N